MKHKIFLLLVAIVASTTLSHAAIVNGTCGDNLTWSLNTKDSTLTIEGTGAMTSVPWSEYVEYIANINLHEGLTSICGYAFKNCKKLISVSIPGTVSSIGWGAFAECTKLSSVFLGDGVTSIDGCAFSGCLNLKTVTIPQSLSSIGVSAFATDYNSNYMPVRYTIRNIYYNGNLEDWCLKSWSTNDVAFIYSLYINGASVTDIIVPNDIISSVGRQFRGCTSLISVTVPEGVTLINDDAFANCSNMESIILPNSVTNIGQYAFVNCNSLVEVTIGNGIIDIGEKAFNNCTNITSLTISALIPPTGGAICGLNATNCTLYVPTSAVETYANSVWWEDFYQIKAIEGNLFTVDFVNWNGQVIVRRFVESGQAAIAPTAPTREGYTFIGWDEDFSNITADLTVTALYEEIPVTPTTNYTLLFTNGTDDSEIASQSIEFTLPTAPVIDGFTFLKWVVVTADLTDTIEIQAVYQANTPTSAPAVYTNPANPAQKLIREGNVYILRGDKTYTLQGQVVQ